MLNSSGYRYNFLLSDNELCIDFPYDADPECSELNNPDECYCNNCNWDWDEGSDGECVDHEGGDNNNGRVKRLEQQRNYKNAMYNFSTSCKDEDLDQMLFNYNQESDGTIYMWYKLDDGSGMCEEVLLEPVGRSGS